MGILDTLLAPLGWGTGANQTGVVTPFSSDSHLAVVTAQELWPDVDLARVMVNRATAMKLSSVARGRNMICQAIGGMPIQTMRGGEVVTNNGFPTLPDPGRARCVMLAYTVDMMLFYGLAWWQIMSRNAYGKPTQARLITNERITFDATRGTVSVDGKNPRPETDFIRIEAMQEGLLTAGNVTLSRAALIEAAAARAGDNPTPSVELHQTQGEPLSREQVDALISRWAAARRGLNGGVAYTTPNVDARMHGQAPEQLLIDGRNAAAKDIARHMNLPAWAVDASTSGSSLTYSNVPSRSRELIDYTLQPFMDAIAGRLSMDDISPAGTWYRLDPSRLLRGDFTDRMTAGKTAVDAGIYTAEEIRRMENETPLEAL